MTETTAKGRGRLSAKRTQEVYDSVLSLLVDNGYEGLTMDAVSHAASISKATLYRQWGGKQALVIDALESNHPAIEIDRIDTGSLRGDLHRWARLETSGPEKDVRLIHAVMHACATNADLRETLRHRMIDRERTDFEQLYRRAIERGELAADAPALPYIVTVLAGAFVLRHLVEDEQPDEAYLVGLIDSVVLPALGVH